VVSFTPRPHYPRGKSLRYPLVRRLGVPQSQSRRFGGKKILDPSGTRTVTPLSSSPYPVAIPTELSRLVPHVRTETDPVTETLCSLEYQTMDKVGKSSTSERYTWEACRIVCRGLTAYGASACTNKAPSPHDLDINV
jgi:hypothetical protein